VTRANEPDIARLYHLNSSNSRHKVPDLEVDEDARPHPFRRFAGAPRVHLPDADLDLSMSLGTVLERRSSVRDFGRRPLPLAMLARLLRISYGVIGRRFVDDHWVARRPAPSAGGLYPVEIHLASRDVDGIEDGLYHYDAKAHELELRKRGSFNAQLADMTIGQAMVKDANVVLLLTAVFQRTMWKYGQRGYRYVWLDAGHVGQNVYLVAEALGLGAVAIGGFFDAEVNRLLDLPPDEESIYLFCIGWPQQP